MFHNMMLMFYQFFFHHKWNDAWLLLINMIYTSCQHYESHTIQRDIATRPPPSTQTHRIHTNSQTHPSTHPNAQKSRRAERHRTHPSRKHKTTPQRPIAPITTPKTTGPNPKQTICCPSRRQHHAWPQKAIAQLKIVTHFQSKWNGPEYFVAPATHPLLSQIYLFLYSDFIVNM